uniref:Uncharacterized protein n=1 Tax=Siphoviridae sp. ctxMM9 TaxID=2827973 RepID=A0A8S5T6F6_9CAUD|nr:MAG TPA: hypothetical protein [Siphoviridae sp. ctxMM9]
MKIQKIDYYKMLEKNGNLIGKILVMYLFTLYLKTFLLRYMNKELNN